MKRFWIEEMKEIVMFSDMILWPCSSSWTLKKKSQTSRARTPSSMPLTTASSSRVPLALVFLMVLFQLVPSSVCTVGKKCDPRTLGGCDVNEICDTADGSVCKCRNGFIENPDTNRCEAPEPPPEPSKSHLALGLGLSLFFFLLFVAITLAALHYKFGLLAGMCDRLPRLRLFGSSGRDFNMVDNEDDDVNPIV